MRELIKGNMFLYRTLIMVRDVKKFPLRRKNGLKLLSYIWRIYPKTMLPPVRLYSLADAVDAIEQDKIAGDVVECGVWSGGALALAALWGERHGTTSRTYIGLDSFEGLPPPTEEDGEVLERFNRQSAKRGRIVDQALMKTGVCVGDAADTVRQFYDSVGISIAKVRFYSGWFQNTLPLVAKEVGSIAILRIDGDWYESTKICLEALYAQVPAGGFIIIDDYGTFTGCRRAVDEFREAQKISASLIFVDKDCVYWRREST